MQSQDSDLRLMSNTYLLRQIETRNTIYMSPSQEDQLTKRILQLLVDESTDVQASSLSVYIFYFNLNLGSLLSFR